MSAVRWLDTITTADVASVGTKAARLGEMSRRGDPVPPGFVVCAGVMEAQMEGSQRQALARHLERLAVEGMTSLSAVAEGCRAVIDGTPLGGPWEAAILEAYGELGEPP